MFIEYKMINNIEYAMLVSSVRVDGKVKKGKRINLGRVIDKQKSIYKNREHGDCLRTIRKQISMEM